MGEIDILARRLLPSFDRGLKLTSVKTYKCSLKRKKTNKQQLHNKLLSKGLTSTCIDHLSRESDGRYVYVRERYLNILFLCCGYDISRPAYQNYFSSRHEAGWFEVERHLREPEAARLAPKLEIDITLHLSLCHIG